MSAGRMTFRGSPLTSYANREASSIENREGGLESKRTRVQRAKEGGKCYEFSAENRGESCAYTTMYSPRSVTAGELVGASELQRPYLLRFRCESTIFDSSESGPTIGLMGAAASGTTWFPVEEWLRKRGWDFESTVAGCEPVELSRRCEGSFTGKILSRQQR